MFDPDNIYRQLVEAGNAWANAHEAAEALRETQKILKAKLTKESPATSHSGREIDALCSPKYEEHVGKAVKATGNEARAKVIYECLKIQAELWRTHAANERAASRNAV